MKVVNVIRVRKFTDLQESSDEGLEIVVVDVLWKLVLWTQISFDDRIAHFQYVLPVKSGEQRVTHVVRTLTCIDAQ